MTTGRTGPIWGPEERMLARYRGHLSGGLDLTVWVTNHRLGVLESQPSGAVCDRTWQRDTWVGLEMEAGSTAPWSRQAPVLMAIGAVGAIVMIRIHVIAGSLIGLGLIGLGLWLWGIRRAWARLSFTFSGPMDPYIVEAIGPLATEVWAIHDTLAPYAFRRQAVPHR